MTESDSPVIVVTGIDAVAWNPGWEDAFLQSGYFVIGIDKVDSPYLNSPAVERMSRTGNIIRLRGTTPSVLINAVAAVVLRRPVAAVINLRDAWILSAAILSEVLGKQGVGLRAAVIGRDKALQRALLPDLSPHTLFLEGRSDPAVSTWSDFPAVLKPAEGTGGSGVSVVDDQTSLKDALDVLSTGSPLLVESLVLGPEYSVESLVRANDIVFAGITCKKNDEIGGHFVEISHTVGPVEAIQSWELLLHANAAAVNALGIQYGMVHAEFRLPESGPSLMELNVRPPGGSIVALYSLAMGVSFERIIVETLLGHVVAMPKAVRIARQGYLPNTTGILTDVAGEMDGVGPEWVEGGDDIRVPKATNGDGPGGIKAVHVGAVRGQAIQKWQNNKDRVVGYLLDAADERELGSLEEEVRRQFSMSIEPLTSNDSLDSC